MSCNYLFIISIVFMSACGSKPVPASGNFRDVTEADTNRLVSDDHTYMRTGFYYVTENDSIRKRKDKSNEVYILSRLPFASVDNIRKIKMEKTKLNTGVVTELCMTFDEQGTKNLAEGTGNPLHPKIAVVIANRLLFVVANTTSIKTGVMCVGVSDYSEQEITAMCKAIDNKQ